MSQEKSEGSGNCSGAFGELAGYIASLERAVTGAHDELDRLEHFLP
jgi:hypothetical protein